MTTVRIPFNKGNSTVNAIWYTAFKDPEAKLPTMIIGRALSRWQEATHGSSNDAAKRTTHRKPTRRRQMLDSDLSSPEPQAWEHDGDEKRPPAANTVRITMYLVLENAAGSISSPDSP